MKIKYIRSLFLLFVLGLQQGFSQSVNLKDSIELYPGLGRLHERKFRIKASTPSCGEVYCTLLLYNQLNSGDGVYKLTQKYVGQRGVKTVIFTSYGRQYTLRGDAENINAVVYQLDEFPSSIARNKVEREKYKDTIPSALMYFLYRNPNLELLNDRLEQFR